MIRKTSCFRLATPLALAVSLTALPSSAPPAHAINRSDYSMEVLVDGRPLPEYASRGTSYVEAIAGREYSVRLTNRTSERIAVALSVDGLNSIDARTTSARDTRKWILDPWQTITLDGWQTSSATARRFFFTTEQESYGAWLGKTKNLGIVSAAFFREKRPRPVALGDRWIEDRGSFSRQDKEGSAEPAPARPADEPPAGAPEAKLQSPRDADAKSGALPGPGSHTESSSIPNRRLSDELAATGIGREIDNPVTQVRFDPEDSPAASLELRYEYHDALVRLGVLPQPRPATEDSLARRERARGFDEPQFAPDPFRQRRHR